MFQKIWTDSTKVWSEAAKSWEAQCAQLWDKALRDPLMLRGLGHTLTNVAGVKEHSDRLLERLWEAWRIPSAADIERLYERMGELDEKLDALNTRLGEPGPERTAA